MRWLQFLLALTNLGVAIYFLLNNVVLADNVDPISFLWILVYLALALAISHLYMLYMSNKIDDWYDVESMKSIENLSIASFTICSIALVTHLGLEYYRKRQFWADGGETTKKLAPLIAAIICSVILFSSSIKFKKYVILCKAVDLPPPSPRRNYRTAD